MRVWLVSTSRLVESTRLNRCRSRSTTTILVASTKARRLATVALLSWLLHLRHWLRLLLLLRLGVHLHNVEREWRCLVSRNRRRVEDAITQDRATDVREPRVLAGDVESALRRHLITPHKITDGLASSTPTTARSQQAQRTSEEYSAKRAATSGPIDWSGCSTAIEKTDTFSTRRCSANAWPNVRDSNSLSLTHADTVFSTLTAHM